jgi:hypothetical protein
MNESEKDTYIKQVEEKIKLEQFKSSLYRNIIEANTNILLSKDEPEDITELFNQLQTLYKSTVLEKPQIEEEYEIKNIEDNKKTLYKSFKNIELVNEPSIDEQNNKISEIDKNIKDDLSGYINISDAKKIFDECFKDIETNRIYTKSLNLIKNTRMRIIGITIDEYTNLLKEHLERLTKIFQDKAISEKISTKHITLSMSSLDLRIISYTPYINTELIIDDLTKFKRCILFTLNFPKYFVPFNYDDFFKTFFNHGTLLSTMRDCIERNLINIYGFNNIVYIPITKSNDNDPFSFFHLKKIENKKRYWNMDCRLEDFSNKFIDNIRPYLIDMFRKMYFDVFCDNDYRDNFLQKVSKIELDLKQIIQNICLLCNPKKFNKFMRKIVKDKATYKVTVNDIKNFSTDDSSQRRRFENEKETIDPVEIMKLMFDNMSSEEAVDYYRSVNIFI